ncbi:MAG: N-acylneuraminate-9-phosphate synthase, partial [Candidatus Electrothrix sp. EH2]|nr:N-acylneuraminate-9-phosphate synthase [Candidatus Electrothrix sp. EH2]
MLKRNIKGQCYIIAEIGGNFTTFAEAQLLIDAAADCGVDAVKLQTYKAENLSCRSAMFNMENTGVASQYELFTKYEIGPDLHQEIFHYAQEKGLDCFSTPSHESDVDLLEKLDVVAHKIGSDDAVNLPFLRYVAQTGKPILLSTGMCTLEEIRESVSEIL